MCRDLDQSFHSDCTVSQWHIPQTPFTAPTDPSLSFGPKAATQSLWWMKWWYAASYLHDIT